MLVMGVLVGAMWLGRIIPSLLSGTAPESLEHYTTLIIQAMDLGLVIPSLIIGGVLTLKKNPIGYFLSVLMSIKTLTLLICISAMIVGMTINGVSVPVFEIIAFVGFNIIAIINIVFVIGSIRQHESYIAEIR